MWDTLIGYWHSTGDSSYNGLVTQGILWQVGPGNNFMPPNETASLGNDDQGIWAMAAMTAAETDITNPSSDPNTQWLALVKNVFESQASRWDESEGQCGGGLRWQIPMSNNGYDYKNSISTGVLFNVAARLGHLTGNATYAEWADKAWTWMESVGYLNNGAIYDGAHVETNCTDINKVQLSYTLGVFIQGAAHMYNSTNANATWRDRLSTLVNGTSTFTDDNCIPVETACEGRNTCTTDMLALKGIFLRGLGSTAQLAPYTAEKLSCVLKGAATAVAASCDDAGDKGAQCGFVWTTGKDDGLHGAGQQMNALAALSIEYLLLAGPAANNTSSGGGSGGGSGSGSGNATQSGGAPTGTSTIGKSGAGMTADRAGAGFLVASAVLAVVFTALLK
jgi:mannan endo-1,6-alpha-mannosidase